MSAAPDFQRTSLLDAPANIIREAESAASTPEQATLLRRLRSWFITPLAERLTEVEPHLAVIEAVLFWRRNAKGWAEAAPEVVHLLREQGVLAGPEGLVSALDGGLPDPEDLLEDLPPRARVYVGAYWRVLEAMLATHHEEVVESVRAVADGKLSDVVDTESETYFALCQALAVAAQHNRIPSATVEILAVALWQTFRRALEGHVGSEVFDNALAGSRDAAKAREDIRPAVSRWKRRPRAGPRGVRIADDFDAPLPEFEDY